MQIMVVDVQAPQSMTAEWLVSMESQTTNCKELTAIISKFKLSPIYQFTLSYNSFTSKKSIKLPWKHQDRSDVVMIYCALHLYKPVIKALKNLFNSKKLRGLQNKPMGTTVKFVPWFSDCNNPDPSKLQLMTSNIARKKHKNWMKNIVLLLLKMLEELYLLINSEGESITLHQVLMALRSRVFYECTLFPAINKHSATGDIVALCHLGYTEEATKMITNLVTLCRERFGQDSAKWFIMEAVEEAMTQANN